MIQLAVHTGIPLADINQWEWQDVLTAIDELKADSHG